MKTPTVKPKFDEVNPEPVEVLVASISRIADAMRTITMSRLTRRAMVALIHDNSGVAKSTIGIVLNNLEALETTWLKPAR